MRYYIINEFYGTLADGSSKKGYTDYNKADARCNQLNRKLREKGKAFFNVVRGENPDGSLPLGKRL